MPFISQGQRQKKLEAKKIREEIEEEEKKRIDIEEAKYQEQKRKEAIEKAKTQQYYQTDRVKGFHVCTPYYVKTIAVFYKYIFLLFNCDSDEDTVVILYSL